MASRSGLMTDTITALNGEKRLCLIPFCSYVYNHMQFDYEVRNKKAWIPIPVLLLTSYAVPTIVETESWFSMGICSCFHINGIPHFQLDTWSSD